MIAEDIRDRAALLCSMCACYHEPISVTRMMELAYGIDREISHRVDFVRLALEAWYAASLKLAPFEQEHGDISLVREYAEAEAMLRTGWTP